MEQPDDDYGRLQTAFHKAPTISIPGSGLACHIGFWAPLDFTAADIDQKLNERKKAIAGHLQYLKEKLHGNVNITWPSDAAAPSLSDQPLDFRFEWRSIPVTFRFEKHKEYTLLFIFMNLHNIKPTNDFTETIIKNLLQIQSLHGKACHDSDSLGQCYSYLYTTIWKIFVKDIYGVDDPSDLTFSDIKSVNFIHFRGIFLETIDPVGTRMEDREWAQTTLKSVWPFMLSEQRVTLEKSDFVACGMLDGCALFVSALGPKVPTPVEGEALPVCYLVCSSRQNFGAIGGLSGKLRRLGTARMASIQEYSKLAEAGKAFPCIQKNINTARRLIHDDINANAPHIKNLLGQLSNEFENLGNGFNGGMRNRIDRSMRYIAQFKEHIEKLEIIAIPGAYSYNEFVELRLSDRFKAIERIKSDYDHLEIDINKVRDDYMWHGNAQNIKEVAKTALSILKDNSEIRNLQTTAEWFLFLVLTPYYLGNSITETFDIGEHSFKRKMIWGGVWLFGAILAIESLAIRYSESTLGRLAQVVIDIAYVPGWFRLFRRLSLGMRLVVGLPIIYALWALVVIYFHCFQ
ncbi:MAG: hypothetical protein M3Z96_01270 [Pseudomonadota bacterium]|nr:hypothetical protein [Pseudomonadota bacterium]